ncbi:MAG: DcaP family trimeric outer membrane transporter [Bacteroidota bacterium]
MKKIISVGALLLLLLSMTLSAQPEDTTKIKVFEIYGIAMTDGGYNFKQINPDWYDVMRPTKLPSFKNEYGTDGNFFFSVRQTRLGFKSWIPTKLGILKTIFEFELFGTGVDAGQTTFRLRHAWGELGHFGAGQTWSLFMDPDVFPNSIEYWGPNGMVFFRNIQIRWMPLMGRNKLSIALERPGASADQGNYADRIELSGVKGRFWLPDLTAQFRIERKWGHIQLAGVLRNIEWVDQAKDTARYDLSGSAIGWGLNLSSNLNIGKKLVGRLQVVYGQGCQNYMNDAPEDIGIKKNPSDSIKPIKGVALPVLGIVAFLDVNWSKKLSSSVGYSRVDVMNSDGQAPTAFKNGQYALANLLYYPVKGVMAGLEFQWGQRQNYSDAWIYDGYKVQISFKYNFSYSFYRKKEIPGNAK